MSRICRMERIGLIVLLTAVGLSGAIGCAVSAASVGPAIKRVPVAGTFFLGGKPIPNAELVFTPFGDNRIGQIGSGLTDVNGEFEISNRHGQSGLPHGSYIVTILRIAPQDGTTRLWADKPAQSPEYHIVPDEWILINRAGRHNMIVVPEEGRKDFQIKIPRKQ